MSDKQVNCDCGATVRAASDEALVEAVQRHAREVHDMDLSWDQIMAMAEVVPAEG